MGLSGTRMMQALYEARPALKNDPGVKNGGGLYKL
jgi:hypothetical protein